MSSLLAILFVQGIWILPATPAAALRVTQVFEGNVTAVRPDGPFGGDAGSRFSYTASYDTAIPGLDSPSDSFGIPTGTGTGPIVESRYASRLLAIQPVDPLARMFTFSNVPNQFEFVVAGRIADSFLVPNFDPSVSRSQAEANALQASQPDIVVANDINAGFFFPPMSSREDIFIFGPIALRDFTASVFADTSLPITLQLADFDSATITITQSNGLNTFANLVGNIDRITTTVVPEPGTLLLIGLGLVGLGLGQSRAREVRERKSRSC